LGFFGLGGFVWRATALKVFSFLQAINLFQKMFCLCHNFLEFKEEYSRALSALRGELPL